MDTNLDRSKVIEGVKLSERGKTVLVEYKLIDGLSQDQIDTLEMAIAGAITYVLDDVVASNSDVDQLFNYQTFESTTDLKNEVSVDLNIDPKIRKKFQKELKKKIDKANNHYQNRNNFTSTRVTAVLGANPVAAPTEVIPPDAEDVADAIAVANQVEVTADSALPISDEPAPEPPSPDIPGVPNSPDAPASPDTAKQTIDLLLSFNDKLPPQSGLTGWIDLYNEYVSEAQAANLPNDELFFDASINVRDTASRSNITSNQDNNLVKWIFTLINRIGADNLRKLDTVDEDINVYNNLTRDDMHQFAIIFEGINPLGEGSVAAVNLNGRMVRLQDMVESIMAVYVGFRNAFVGSLKNGNLIENTNRELGRFRPLLNDGTDESRVMRGRISRSLSHYILLNTVLNVDNLDTLKQEINTNGDDISLRIARLWNQLVAAGTANGDAYIEYKRRLLDLLHEIPNLPDAQVIIDAINADQAVTTEAITNAENAERVENARAGFMRMLEALRNPNAVSTLEEYKARLQTPIENLQSNLGVTNVAELANALTTLGLATDDINAYTLILDLFNLNIPEFDINTRGLAAFDGQLTQLNNFLEVIRPLPGAGARGVLTINAFGGQQDLWLGNLQGNIADRVIRRFDRAIDALEVSVYRAAGANNQVAAINLLTQVKQQLHIGNINNLPSEYLRNQLDRKTDKLLLITLASGGADTVTVEGTGDVNTTNSVAFRATVENIAKTVDPNQILTRLVNLRNQISTITEQDVRDKMNARLRGLLEAMLNWARINNASRVVLFERLLSNNPQELPQVSEAEVAALADRNMSVEGARNVNAANGERGLATEIEGNLREFIDQARRTPNLNADVLNALLEVNGSRTQFAEYARIMATLQQQRGELQRRHGVLLARLEGVRENLRSGNIPDNVRALNAPYFTRLRNRVNARRGNNLIIPTVNRFSAQAAAEVYAETEITREDNLNQQEANADAVSIRLMGYDIAYAQGMQAMARLRLEVNQIMREPLELMPMAVKIQRIAEVIRNMQQVFAQMATQNAALANRQELNTQINEQAQIITSAENTDYEPTPSQEVVNQRFQQRRNEFINSTNAGRGIFNLNRFRFYRRRIDQFVRRAQVNTNYRAA